MAVKNRGRPSRQEQVQIVRTLRPYFERGMNATFTAGITGINIKTVCNYFNGWYRQLMETQEQDFVKRQRQTKEHAILCLDYLINKQYELLDEIKNEIIKYKKDGKFIPKHLLSLNAQILRDISDMTQQKGDIALTPTIDVSLEKIVDERLTKAAAA